EVLRFGALQAGPRHRGIEHGAALVELGLVLREVRRHDAVPEPQLAGRRVAETEERLEERRLPRPVGADECNVLAAFDCKRSVVQQLLVAGADGESLCDSDVTAGPRGLQELEAQSAPALLGLLHAHRLDPLDLLELRLRLPRLARLVAEALDEALEA